MKILKYYNSTILYKSPKNPIFVQLSPIQCTYSNIFIRFFKFFPANTNIYQNSYSVIGALCGLRQGVLSLRAYHGTLIVLRATHFMSLRGIANGDAVAISRKGYLVINPRKILLYLRGEKGAHKQKSERYRLR